jgi:signal transduction histidine kinase
LKNDLHSIAINLEVLRARFEKQLSKDQAAPLLRHLEVAVEHFRMVKAKVEGAVSLFEIEPARPRRSSAEKVIKRAMREIRPLALQAGVEIAIAGESATALFVDEAQVAQALTEVLKNAVEATPRGDRVSVSVRDLDRGVEIRVANPGSSEAVPSGELPAPFHSNKPGHVGLGLALVRQLLAQNHARLQITARRGRVTAIVTFQEKSE